ncbi:MAG: hypothetical protein U0836_20420 [Pirellulales bacterium]
MNPSRPHLLLLPFAVLLADMAALAQVTGEEKWPDLRLLVVVSLALSQAPLVAVWATLQRELTASARWALSAGVVFLWSWQLRQKTPQLAPELADWLLVLGSTTVAAAALAWLSPTRTPSASRWQFSLGTLCGLLTLAACGATLTRHVSLADNAWTRAIVIVAGAAALAACAWRMALPATRLLRGAVPLAAAALVAGQAMVWVESAAASQWRLAMGLVAAQSAAIVVAGKTLASTSGKAEAPADDSSAQLPGPHGGPAS